MNYYKLQRITMNDYRITKNKHYPNFLANLIIFSFICSYFKSNCNYEGTNQVG